MAYIWWLMMKMWSILHVLEKNCYKLCAIVLVAEKWADVLLIRLKYRVCWKKLVVFNLRAD